MMEGRAGHPRLLRGSSGQTFALLEITGASEERRAGPQSASNLSIVIDRSGSMRGTRIRNALTAATKAVQHLRDGDSVSVIAFDQRSEVIVPRTFIDGASRQRVLAGIDRIGLGGDTCMSCGISEGLAQLGRSDQSVSRMILLSDGDANRGLRDVTAFRSLGATARAQGVSITSIGVDVDFNEKLLSAVSAESNGRVVFVENDASLERVFEDETARLTSTVAANAEVSIELPSGVDLVKVYDRAFQRSGRTLTVPIGSLNKGDVRTVLLELRVDTRDEGRLPLANVKMTYRDLATGRDATCEGNLAVESTNDPSRVSALDPVVLGRLQRVETASVLREVNDLVNEGKGDLARRRLEDSSARIAALSASASATGGARAGDVKRDFEGQQASLEKAKQGVAAAPAPGSPPAAMPREAKARMKRNAIDAFDSGF
jgi:Ca-activated chloride channel family protein